MKLAKMSVAASSLALVALGSQCFAQSSVDMGKREYEASCASCHGVSAKGDGVMRSFLTKVPADLTVLAKKNGGVFPVKRISDYIDGRTSAEIGPHGAREMPVWGNVYRSEDTQPYDLHARIRIASLIDYLARIQEK